MDIFSKTFSIFSALTNALTLPGLLLLCTIGLIASIWAMMSPKGRMLFFIMAVFCYALSMDKGRGESARVPLPNIMITVAYAFKWIFIVPLILYGTIVSLTGRGASFLTTIALFSVCVYIFFRAFMSGSWDRYFLWILMVVGLPGLGAQLCRELGTSTIFRYLFFLAYLTIFIAALQMLIRPGMAWRGLRYCGFMPNPNAMGAFLGCLIVPGLWVFFERSRTKLVMILVVILCVMLLATGSRAAACQVLPAALLIAILYSKKPLMWITFMLSGLAIILAGSFLLNEEMMERFLSAKSSGRVELWQEYWRIGMENPVLGRGMGWISAMDMYPPHNGFVFLFVESGMVGMILMAAVLFYVIFRNPGRKYYYLFPEQRQLRWFVFAQLLGFLISGFFESWFIGIGYFELVLFLFTVGIKDELDISICLDGQAYWDDSMFLSFSGQNDFAI